MKVNQIFVLLMIVMLVVSGCGEDSVIIGRKEDVKLLVAFSQTGGFLAEMKKSMEDYAKSNNLDYTLVDANGDIVRQFEQLEEAQNGDYDAIVLNLVDRDTALQAIRMFEGIPVIFYNSPVDEAYLAPNERIYVGSDENTAGGLQADFLVNYFGGKKSLDLVLLRGENIHPAARLRTESVKRGLTQAGIEVRYVFEDDADWSRTKAEEYFSVFLQTGQSFDGVICNNDEMAIGVINAMIDKGMNPSSVPIVGVDATAAGCEEIEKGNMVFTVFQPGSGQGITALQAAVELGSGGKLDDFDNITEDGKFIWIPFEPVDSSNVANYK